VAAAEKLASAYTHARTRHHATQDLYDDGVAPPTSGSSWGNVLQPKSKTAKQLFEDAQWELAYAASPGLKTLRVYVSDEPEVVEAARDIRDAWRELSATERQAWKDKARALARHAAAYARAQVNARGERWHASLLEALLARSAHVHTLNLESASSLFANVLRPPFALAPADGLLRRIGAKWGATTLRLLHLGSAALTVGDAHALLAACPLLTWLNAAGVRLLHDDGSADGNGADLFRDMTRHAALRSVALPPTAQAHLYSYTQRLCAHCPALREIDADVFDAYVDKSEEEEEEEDIDDDAFWNIASSSDDDDAVQKFDDGCETVAACARFAAQHGVRRFICSSFFAEGGSDGEYGSDGGSVGEYCGDGNVLKYLGVPQ
jgi:hypothetical protein